MTNLIKASQITNTQTNKTDDQLSRGKRANSIGANLALAGNRAELEAESDETAPDPMEVSSATANEATRGQFGNLGPPTEMDAARQLVGAGTNQRLHIVHLLTPEATQNATQNVTLGE